MLKGGLIGGLLWLVWFRKRETTAQEREFIVAGCALSIATLFVARALALLLPFRERPRFDAGLHLIPPPGADGINLIHWSSFPSDNAALYFALATTLFLVSRKLGIFAYLHALLLVTLPRIYFGWHYPSDILAGALLGIGLVSLCRIDRLRHFLARVPVRWEEHRPELFYFCFYVFTFLLASEFNPVRTAATHIWRMWHRLPAVD
jgi:undecaprenyl-diphosphatase